MSPRRQTGASRIVKRCLWCYKSNSIPRLTQDAITLRSRDNFDANRLGLRDDTLAQALEAQSRQPGFGVLDLGNLIDVLQGDRATALVAGTHGTTETVLSGFDKGGVEQEVGGSRSAQIKGKGSVGADGDARGDRDADIDVGSACIEFLKQSILLVTPIPVILSRSINARGGGGWWLTLQKSILLTPLLPRAGPTGGLGLA